MRGNGRWQNCFQQSQRGQLNFPPLSNRSEKFSGSAGRRRKGVTEEGGREERELANVPVGKEGGRVKQVLRGTISAVLYIIMDGRKNGQSNH